MAFRELMPIGLRSCPSEGANLSGEYFGNLKLSFKKSIGKELSFSLSFGEAGKFKFTLE